MADDPATYAPPLRPPAPALAKLSLPLPQSCHSSVEEAAGSLLEQDALASTGGVTDSLAPSLPRGGEPSKQQPPQMAPELSLLRGRNAALWSLSAEDGDEGGGGGAEGGAVPSPFAAAKRCRVEGLPPPDI